VFLLTNGNKLHDEKIINTYLINKVIVNKIDLPIVFNIDYPKYPLSFDSTFKNVSFPLTVAAPM
jgi:hypothetical protein